MSIKRLVAFAVIGAAVGVAYGQIGMPEVVVTPVAHQGDPGLGIAGATMQYLGTPQIDAAGNVLFMVFMDGPGIDESNDKALLFGQPGQLQVVIQEGQPAPDLGGDVTISSLLTAGVCVSETGWIGYSPRLTGPGIVEGVNDRAAFVGPPGDIRKVLQAGDPAPGLEPGVILAATASGASFRVYLSDAATLLVLANLAGAGVDDTNDRAVWIGSRDDLQLVYREGMPAPGTEVGVTFAGIDSAVFNDTGEIAFRGVLIGDEGVDSSNHVGYWTGTPGALQLVARGGEPAYGVEEGVVYHSWGTGFPALNAAGDLGYWMLLAEEGSTPDDDHGAWVYTAEGTWLIARTGDPMPEAGPGVVAAFVGAHWVNARREVIYHIHYAGEGIDETNAYGVYLGPYHSPVLSLRDGDPAPRFGPDTFLAFVGAINQNCAMNDNGDIVGTGEIVGADVTDEDKVVLWLRHGVLEQWVPLLRGGTVIAERTIFASYYGDFDSNYNYLTGGSDGKWQSLNDSGQLAIRLEFTDGTHGIYRIEPPVFGDTDGDHDVDLSDLNALESCLTSPGDPVAGGCELVDFDWDDDVDLEDFGIFQRLFTGAQ